MSQTLSRFTTPESGYIDELIWGGIWLYLATNEETYLNQALKAVEEWPKDWDYTFTMSWDNTFLLRKSYSPESRKKIDL